MNVREQKVIFANKYFINVTYLLMKFFNNLAQGREQWRDLVFAAMSFRVPNA